MRKIFFRSLIFFLLMTFLTGLCYPLAVTGIAYLFFRDKALGSLIHKDNKLIGSELLAQNFQSERYFWPRPSATDFQGIASGGSNLGPTSQKLQERIRLRIKQLGIDEKSSLMPYDLLLTSASGLDPHIRPETALFQAFRISKVRNLDIEKIKSLIAQQTEEPWLGYLGRPRINVLKLNLALDKINP